MRESENKGSFLLKKLKGSSAPKPPKKDEMNIKDLKCNPGILWEKGVIGIILELHKQIKTPPLSSQNPVGLMNLAQRILRRYK